MHNSSLFSDTSEPMATGEGEPMTLNDSNEYLFMELVNLTPSYAFQTWHSLYVGNKSLGGGSERMRCFWNVMEGREKSLQG